MWQSAEKSVYGLLKANASNNRKNPTEAESVFWQYAKKSGFGQKCRRQYVIGSYIVDFIFLESKLIVEIDGGYHLEEEQVVADNSRQQYLESKGFRIIRFTNEQVFFDIDNVIQITRKKLIIN